MLEDHLRFLQAANRQEVRRQQPRDVAGEHEQLRVTRVARDAGVQHAQRDHRVRRFRRGAAQKLDTRKEATRQREEVGRRGVGLGGRGQKGAQIGIVTGLSGEDGGSPRGLADRTRPAGRRRPC